MVRHAIEVGDHVQARPVDEMNWYYGEIIAIGAASDGTCLYTVCVPNPAASTI